MRAALIVALAACGSAPPPVTVPVSHVDVVPRTTPAPTVKWAGDKLAAPGLPAAASHGEIAVIPMSDLDGGRGWPNLHIEVRDRADKLIQTIPVMTPNEYETFVVGGKPTAKLDERIAAANRELAKLHGVHDLVTLHALELGGSDDAIASGDGLDVEFRGNRIRLFHRPQQRPFDVRSAQSWLIPETTDRGRICDYPASLAGVFHASEIPLVVVEIEYRSSDTCRDPSPSFHVVAY